jgi:hypothetical protein
MSDFDPATGIAMGNPVSGAQLIAYTNELAAFVLSSGYGADTPVNAATGQIWARNTGGPPDPHIFDGIDDVLIYTAANIVGNVAASGSGDNTGKILEIGRVASTLYAKFAGGIAVCAARLSNHPGGSETWNLPVTFTDTAKMHVVGTTEFPTGPRIVTASPASLSSVSVSVWSHEAGTSGAAANMICVGPWTEEFF